VDLRQSKRYRLRAPVVFSWELPSGISTAADGHTRDISPSGVFVLTSNQLLVGAIVNLEISLPSSRGESSGAFLRTVGHVVRTEEAGFAAVADMGFKMQFPHLRSQRSFGGAAENGSQKQESREVELNSKSHDLVSRFSM
jgi:PilZ domain